MQTIKRSISSEAGNWAEANSAAEFAAPQFLASDSMTEKPTDLNRRPSERTIQLKAFHRLSKAIDFSAEPHFLERFLQKTFDGEESRFYVPPTPDRP